jgi:multiple sugar transport system permease protein
VTSATRPKPAAPAAHRHKRVYRPGTFWTGVGATFIIVYCLAPFYWMAVTSFKSQTDIFNNDLIPRSPSLENYRAVFGPANSFTRNLLNSTIVAGSVTLIALVVAIFAAYALARLRFRLKVAILGVVLATAMFPSVVILTPIFQLFTDLGWIDTYQAIIIPDISFALPLAIWVLTSFFAEMPWELEQAAQLDGCTPAQAFRLIIIPLAAPGVFTTIILIFVSTWNEYLIASAMSLTPQTNTVTVGIAKFTGSSQFEQPFGTQMAAGVIVTVPLLIMVLIFQKRIIAGLTAGGVKE